MQMANLISAIVLSSFIDSALLEGHDASVPHTVGKLATDSESELDRDLYRNNQQL